MNLKDAIVTLEYIVKNQKTVSIDKIKESVKVLVESNKMLRVDNKRLRGTNERQRNLIKRLEKEVGNHETRSR